MERSESPGNDVEYTIVELIRWKKWLDIGTLRLNSFLICKRNPSDLESTFPELGNRRKVQVTAKMELQKVLEDLNGAWVFWKDDYLRCLNEDRLKEWKEVMKKADGHDEPEWGIFFAAQPDWVNGVTQGLQDLIQSLDSFPVDDW